MSSGRRGVAGIDPTKAATSLNKLEKLKLGVLSKTMEGGLSGVATAATDRSLQFVVNGNTLSTTGYAYTFTNSASSPGSWTANGGNDYAFYLSAVPEPGAFALAGLGMLLLLIRRRRGMAH